MEYNVIGISIRILLLSKRKIKGTKNNLWINNKSTYLRTTSDLIIKVFKYRVSIFFSPHFAVPYETRTRNTSLTTASDNTL